MSEDNKALVRGFYDDINRGAVDAFMAKLADDFVEHEAFPGVPPSKHSVGMLFEQLRKAFSGFQMNVEAIASEGDMVLAFLLTDRHNQRPAGGRAIVAAVRGVLGIFNANKAHSE